MIATLAVKESQISFWQPSQGFLDSLKGAFGGGNSSAPHLNLPLGAGRLKPYRTFTLGKPSSSPVDIQQVIDVVKFDWTGERSVKVTSLGIELNFSV